jgi:bifunctional N-acetylglucosamine-1-phosphate-uridyltransferase/glucosamine-1-phosphate-acetyltransferase GlmU-like protein
MLLPVPAAEFVKALHLGVARNNPPALQASLAERVAVFDAMLTPLGEVRQGDTVNLMATLLETNGILLRKGAAHRRDFPGVTIVDPVYIEDGVVVERSTVGPNVSIEAGTRIADCTIRNTIIGRDAVISTSSLDGALLGNRVKVTGLRGNASLGDDCELHAH